MDSGDCYDHDRQGTRQVLQPALGMSFVDRRRPAFTAELLIRAAIVWAVVALIFVLTRWSVFALAALLPLAALFAAIVLAGRIAWRIFDAELIGYTGLLLALAFPLAALFQPAQAGVAAWQVVALLAALNGLIARNAALGGWIAGIALGCGLAGGVLLAPVAALFAVMLAVRWMSSEQERDWLPSLLRGLMLSGGAIYLLRHGLTLRGAGCGLDGAAGLGAVAIAMAGTSALALAPRLPRVPLAGALLLVAAAATGSWLAIDPACAARTGYALGGGVAAWSAAPAAVLQALLPPLVGLFAAFNLCARAHAWARNFWREYALVAGGLLAFAMFDLRFVALAQAAALVPLAWQVRQWSRAAQKVRWPARRALAFAATALAVVPALPVLAVQAALPG